MPSFVDLTGLYFGEWVVMGRSSQKGGNLIKWDCRCSCGRQKVVFGSNLKRGLSTSCGECRTLCGVGIIDVEDNSEGSAFKKTWKRMIERCYSQVVLSENETYKDKRVAEDWLRFSKFKHWMERQDWQGMELDKDLKILGNKVYSEDSCSFIPKRINLLLSLSDASRTELPIGVTRHSQATGSYQSRCGRAYLGLYNDPMSAHSAWQQEKAKQIREAVEWWENSQTVKQTFNTGIANNLLFIADKVQAESFAGIETKRFY